MWPTSSGWLRKEPADAHCTVRPPGVLPSVVVFSTITPYRRQRGGRARRGEGPSHPRTLSPPASSGFEWQSPLTQFWPKAIRCSRRSSLPHLISVYSFHSWLFPHHPLSHTADPSYAAVLGQPSPSQQAHRDTDHLHARPKVGSGKPIMRAADKGHIRTKPQ